MSGECSGRSAFSPSDGNKITSIFAGIICVSIPREIEFIDDGDTSSYAFKESSSTLVTIKFDEAVNLKRIGSSAFFNCKNVQIFDLSYCSSLTSIGWGAFRYCISATSFVLPNDTLSTIEGSTFAECNALKLFFIPSSITSIKSAYPVDIGAFYKCRSLVTVLFAEDSKMYSIGGKTFLSSSLQYITIPKTVQIIDAYSFRVCLSLQKVDVQAGSLYFKSINGVLISIKNELVYYPQLATRSETAVIPNSIVSLAEYCFIGVSSYKYVSIPPSVMIFYGSAFYGFAGLTQITIPSQITELPTMLFGYCNKLKNITFQNSFNVIPKQFCYGCSSLTNFTIPSGVSTLSSSAFERCTLLCIVYCPKTLTIFGSGIFTGCASNLQLLFEPGSTVQYIDEYLYNPEINKLLIYLGSLTTVTIKATVQTICNGAFEARAITQVIYESPDNITSIESYAFSNCKSLTSFVIPQKITKITDYMLQMSGITSITIPNSVTTIGIMAFQQCRSLSTIILPDSLKLIKESAFLGCSSLKSIDIPNSVKEIELEVFKLCTSLTTLKLPDLTKLGTNAFYDSGIVSFSFSDLFSMENFVSYSFCNCNKLTSFTIPLSVKTISENAFLNCARLETVTLGSSIVSIKNYAFSSCSSLKTVIIGSNVNLQTIDYLCFASCPKLEFFDTSGENLFTFESGILYNKAKTNIMLFLRASNPESIIIPSTVKAINTNSFSSCQSLRNVTFLGHCVESIGISAFQYCSSLQHINFPSSLINIDSNAFNSCNLISISLSLTHITNFKDNVFSNNSRLSRIILPTSILRASSSAFSSISHSATVFYFGDNVIINSVGLSSSSKVICFEDYPNSIFFGRPVIRNHLNLCSVNPQKMRKSNACTKITLLITMIFLGK